MIIASGMAIHRNSTAVDGMMSQQTGFARFLSRVPADSA
jgi:hypothetical protein